MLVAAILLNSCTKESVQEVGNIIAVRLVSDSTEVIQTGGIEKTRANDGVNDNATFNFPADFTVAVDGKNYVYVASAANTNMTSAAPACYPVNGSSVRIQAFYPSFAMQYAASPQTFTVAQNQCQTSMGTINYTISDLMYGVPPANGTIIGGGTWNGLDGSGKVNPTADAIPLVFEHMMVKIRIDITISSGVTVKGITMKNVQRAIDFNTADATFSNLATAADGMGDKVLMYDDATGITTNFTCTALIPQQGLAAETPFIDVLIESLPSDKTLTYKLHEAANFISGRQYIYTLTVSMDEVNGLSCEIANWNAAPADPEFTQIKTL